MFNQRNWVHSFMLLILERYVNVFKIILFLTGCLYDRNWGLVQISDFLNEFIHIHQLAANTLENFMYFSLMMFKIEISCTFVLWISQTLLSNNYNIDIWQVEMKVSSKGAENVDFYQWNFLLKSSFYFFENSSIPRSLSLIIFLYIVSKLKYFFS